MQRRAAKYDLFSASDGVDFLLELADQEQLAGWVLFANSDETVKFLSQHRDRLGQRFRVPLPPWDVTQRFFDKANAYRAAAAAGIPIPRMYHADSLAAIDAGADLSRGFKAHLQRKLLRKNAQESHSDHESASSSSPSSTTWRR